MPYLYIPALDAGTPMGMNKASKQGLSSDNWTLITGWTPRAGFPETAIVSNGLQMVGAAYIFELKVTLSSGDESATQLRIYRGGTIIGTATSGSSQVLTLTCTTAPTVVSDGDIITAQVMVDSSADVTAGANTYLTATPA